jgi:hypothetical protein
VPYIFLNPDGTAPLGLQVIVEARTGVVYAHQCGGYLAETREAEGFLLPVDGAEAARPIASWFWETFQGHCEGPAAWDERRLRELAALVSRVPCWLTHPAGREDERRFLEFDNGRINDCVEAWIPVRTPYGRGILIFDNSD